MEWKKELIRDYPEWEYYYESFDLWLQAKAKMKIFDEISRNGI